MTPEEYAAQQALISAATARYVASFGSFFTNPLLSLADWLGLLKLLFPQIQQLREQSATLARTFYDSQRTQYHPELPRNDRPLEGAEFKEFVSNMEPVRDRMSREDSPQDAVAALTMRAVREVENAGRQQIIHAVANDSETRIVRGWARVATGRETCAWCLMLISRGPTYLSAGSAGLDIDDTSALKSFRGNDLDTFFSDISDDMEQWHTGCDCKVVPVFKLQSWPGQAASARALAQWNEATKVAIEEEKEGKVHLSGVNKGKPLTRNELAINALRRGLANGDINMADFALTA